MMGKLAETVEEKGSLSRNEGIAGLNGRREGLSKPKWKQQQSKR
ncbi:MAG TPA: hypothetical protein VNS08_03720 [Ureibacillus sp.]|nr:hypothetical protein [Ureibacillus sp.]